MNSQIFKKRVPTEILFDFLNIISIKTEKHYIVDNIAYKKANFLRLVQPLFETLKPYYHVSKQFYITRKITYTSFITIIRQVCRHNNLIYSSKISYLKSNYDIIYHVRRNASPYQTLNDKIDDKTDEEN